MALPEALAGLLQPAAYPHPCGHIELVETHISWVLLTGDFAYKIKKPVQFSFADFSSLALRRHFCEEELRCNRAFAPDLYLDLVAVQVGRADGLRVGPAVSAPADGVLEWAVQMRQFPPHCQADRLLEQNQLTVPMMHAFGGSLGLQYRERPAARFEPSELGPRVLDPVRENFTDMEQLAWTARHAGLLGSVKVATEEQSGQLRDLLLQRLTSGVTRECHGDLHLSNLMLLRDAIAAFDCIEFSPVLRWIDPVSDVAFLYMDCLIRKRADLAYAFVDGYLDVSGDYEGLRLLAFYAGYRSMVRAKIAALRREQLSERAQQQAEERCLQHLQWVAGRQRRPPGILVLMCGLSGSGKSTVAAQLAVALPALRLRSDVARKALAGLTPEESAAAPVGTGIYAAARTDAVYGYLEELAAELLRSGENVIVDATFLQSGQRERFLSTASVQGAPAVVVHCDAPVDVLRQRITARAATGGGASDADLAVLEHQAGVFEVPTQHTLRLDTQAVTDMADLVRRITAKSRT